MASYPVPDSALQQQPHAAPYCNDPNCEYCKDLHDLQESIRTHELGSTAVPET